MEGTVIVPKLDLDIQLDGKVLIVSARHQAGRTAMRSSSRYHRRSFCRSLALPDGVDTSKIDALYHCSVFEIRVPKAEEVHHRRCKVNGVQSSVIS